MMSRYPRRFACLSLPVLAGLLLAILLTLPLPARAGVIAVDRSTYRLDGGKPVTGMRPNLERVLAVKPDLVLQLAGRGEALDTAEKLGRLDIPVAVFAVSDFPGLFAAIDRIGLLTGEPEAAQTLRQGLEKRLAAVKTAIPAGKRPTVFFEARSGNLLTAGKESMPRARPL